MLRFLVGTTASGKSELALDVAERAGAEIASMDSMLVYRGMDIGTAKPGREARQRVRHHLLDLVEPWEDYDVQRYVTDASQLLEASSGSGRELLFVGGTALYLRALIEGLFGGPRPDRAVRERVREEIAREGSEAAHARLGAIDPPSARRIHPHDERRIARALEVWEQTARPLSDWQREWGFHGERTTPSREHRIVALSVPSDELDRRIAARTRAMLEAGWVEEVRAIQAAGGFSRSASQAIGLNEVLDLAAGKIAEAEAERLINLRTRQFARAQRTWLRKFPQIRWLTEPTAVQVLLELAWP